MIADPKRTLAREFFWSVVLVRRFRIEPDVLSPGMTWVILLHMKTAISVPDAVFKAAERVAKKLKLSRSELYTRALKEFLAAKDDLEVERSLNEVYGAQPSSVDPVLSAIQVRAISRVEW